MELEHKRVEEQPKDWKDFKEAGFDTVKFLPVDDFWYCLLCDRRYQIPDERVVLFHDLEHGVVYGLCYPECDRKMMNNKGVREGLSKKIESILESGERVEEHEI